MLVYMPSPYWMSRSTKAAKLALRRAFTRPAARSVVNLSAAALARVVMGCPAFSRSHLSVCPRRSVCPAGADQAGLVGDDDQLRPVPGPELGHRPGGVRLGGGGAQVELVGDLFVGQAAGDQRDDFPFAPR